MIRYQLEKLLYEFSPPSCHNQKCLSAMIESFTNACNGMFLVVTPEISSLILLEISSSGFEDDVYPSLIAILLESKACNLAAVRTIKYIVLQPICNSKLFDSRYVSQSFSIFFDLYFPYFWIDRGFLASTIIKFSHFYHKVHSHSNQF